MYNNYIFDSYTKFDCKFLFLFSVAILLGKRLDFFFNMKNSEIMDGFIHNTTIIAVKPFDGHGWVKWCALAMYLETLVCCYILGRLVWKEISKKLSAISFRPLTQQLVVFSIIMVSYSL